MSRAPTPSMVYVCPSKDIECGTIPANWCTDCPKRKPQVWALNTPTGPFIGAEQRGAETILTGIAKCDLLSVEDREKLVSWLRRQYNIPG